MLPRGRDADPRRVWRPDVEPGQLIMPPLAPVPAAAESIPDTKPPELRSHFPDSQWQTRCLLHSQSHSYPDVNYREIMVQIWVTWEVL